MKNVRTDFLNPWVFNESLKFFIQENYEIEDKIGSKEEKVEVIDRKEKYWISWVNRFIYSWEEI